MFRFTIRDVLWLTLVGGVVLASCGRVNDSPVAAPRTISATALTSGECQIIGLLGRPYGEIVRIRGTWEENASEIGKIDGAFTFRVTRIDGRELDTDHEIRIPSFFVDYWSGAERPAAINDGDVYDGPAFESGKYVRAPTEVYDLLGEEQRLAADMYAFEFYSFLYLIRDANKVRPIE